MSDDSQHMNDLAPLRSLLLPSLHTMADIPWEHHDNSIYPSCKKSFHQGPNFRFIGCPVRSRECSCDLSTQVIG